MSKENVKLFFEKVQADKGLQEKLKNLHSENQDKLQESIVKLGAEMGHDFNIEDMQQLAEEIAATMQQNDELNDEQLEAVAGGGTGSWVVVSILGFYVCALSGMKRRSDDCSLDQIPF